MKQTLIHLTLCADFEYQTLKSPKQESTKKTPNIDLKRRNPL